MEETSNTATNLGWLNALFQRRGLFYALIVAVCWCLSDVCTKVLSASVHPMEIAFVRQFMLALTVTPCTIYRNKIARDSVKYWKLLSIRGVCSTVNTLFRTLACNFMSIGNVSAVSNTTPIFAGILGWILLKERITIKEGAISLIGIAGVLLIAQPPFIFKTQSSEASDENFIGVIFALGEAVTSALSIVLLRKLGGKNVDLTSAITYFAVIGVVIDGLLNTVFNGWTLPPCLPERLLFLAFSPLVFGAQVYLFLASKLERALNVSLMLLTTICISLTLQWFIFHDGPTWISILGTLLVLLSAATLSIMRSHTEKPNPPIEESKVDENETDL